MKLTIRIKLLIGFTLLLLLFSLTLDFTFSVTNRYIASQIDELQTLQAKKGAGEVENFFSTINLDTFGLASIFGKENLTTEDFTQQKVLDVVTYVFKNKEYIKKISVLSPQGKELMKFDSLNKITKEALSYEVYSDPFKLAAVGTTSISKVYFIQNQSGLYVDIFSPIFSAEKKVIGVLKTQVSLERLQKNIGNIKTGNNGFLYIVDSEGTLIAHHSQKFVLQRPDLSSRMIIAKSLKKIPITSADEKYVNENNVPVVARAVRTPGYNWIVVFEQPTEEAFGFLSFINNLLLATLFGSFIFLLLISFILSENFTRPIRKLQQSALLLEKGQLNTDINIKSGDEIEALSHAFASMVNQLLQRENSLRREKKETETLLQSLTDGVIALDQQGTIIAFNRAAERTSGFNAAEAVGKNIDEVLHFYEKQEIVPFFIYNQQTEAMVKKLREKGLHLAKSDNTKVSLALTTSPVLFEDQKTGFIIAFHDITREQELEEMKLDFVSMAAHELRTPLTAIRGYASILEMQNSRDLNQSGKDMLKRLVVSSETLGNLIENLLSVSRIERSMFSINTRLVDLTTTIKNSVDNVRQQALTKKQTLTLILPDELPAVIADSFRIGQVILNLVANAVNYTQEGGNIVIKAERKENNLLIAVSDNGRGIPPEAMQKLFTKFFRVSGALEQGSKGTGLGLYISKSIIQMHKGKIWVESTVGKGSTFAFTLPIVSPAEIESYQKAHSLTPIKSELTPKT